MSQKVGSQDKQRKIGEIELGSGNRLVATLVNVEKLDLRIFVNSDSYSRPTKRGVRFYLFDGIWDEFKKLIEKVDKEVKDLE